MALGDDHGNLKVRVGVKEADDLLPIGCCFEHSRASVWEGIERSERSTLVASITAHAQAGRCGCDDYLDDSMGLRLPLRRRANGTLQVGPFECTGDPWMLEPELGSLIQALRWVYEHREEARQRGEAARAQAQSGWSWSDSAAEARTRLAELTAPPAPRRLTPARLWSEPKAKGSRQTTDDRKGKGQRGHRRPSPSGLPAADHRLPAARPRISLCMIVRDEAPRIAQCLKSIAPWVDEMIVVDTGSRDRTREIARDGGAQVFDFPWTDSFAEARNQSIQQARGDWIFWMDADDVIAPESGRQFRELIRRHPQRDVAYQVQVQIPPGPGESNPHFVDHAKLFPNRPDLRFEHRIHEQILPSLRRAGVPVLPSEVVVTHQNYDRSPEGQAKKRRRDFRLLGLDLRDRPGHPFVLFNLGMTHLYATREYAVAAHYLRRCLDLSDWKDSIVGKAHAMLAAARIGAREWEAALAVNEEGRSHYPDDAELLFQAGQLYQQAGRFDAARAALERLVDGKEDRRYRSVDAGLRTYRGRHELALLFRRMGDAPHCEAVLCQLAASFPHYLPAQVDLAETLLALGKKEAAEALLGKIPAVAGIEEEIRRLRGLLGDG